MNRAQRKELAAQRDRIFADANRGLFVRAVTALEVVAPMWGLGGCRFDTFELVLYLFKEMRNADYRLHSENTHRKLVIKLQALTKRERAKQEIRWTIFPFWPPKNPGKVDNG